MSNLEQPRFVTISNIIVHDTRKPEGSRIWKARVVITHASGAEETFVGEAANHEIEVKCKTFLALDEEIKIKVHRSGFLSGWSVKKATFSFAPSATQTTWSVAFENDAHLRLEIFLAQRATGTEVAHERLFEAEGLLSANKETMKKLEKVAGHLKLLVGVADSASGANVIAKAVCASTKTVFERISDAPGTYGELVEIIKGAIDGLDTLKDASTNFDTVMVCDALNRLIDRLVEIVLMILAAYKGARKYNFFKAPKKNDVDKVRQAIQRCEAQLRAAYTVEIRGVLSRIEHGLGSQSQPESEHLRKLLPPGDCLHSGKRTCLEGTRKSTLDTITNWVRNDSRTSRLYWIQGVAGCGKSALAASIARILKLEKKLAGSFFCKRDQDERRNPVRLIWTIAYYLAERNAQYRELLLAALSKQDAFVNIDIRSQFENLLEDPLRAVSSTTIESEPVVFVIDALDECDEHGKIARLLRQLLELAPWLKLIVTSRALPEIRNSFNIPRDAVLDLFANKEEARADIHSLLEYELSPEGRITWLAEEDKRGTVVAGWKQKLVEKSQDLFIWLETAVKFIALDGGSRNIVDRILSQDPLPDAEHELDALYRIVISEAAKTNTAKNLVPCIIALVLASSKTQPLSPQLMYAFLPSPSVMHAALRDIIARMSPILVLKGSEEDVVVTHTSVLDFFACKSRCGVHGWLSLEEGQRIMAMGCLEIMIFGARQTEGAKSSARKKPLHAGLRFNICNLESSYVRDDKVTGPNLTERIHQYISPELLYSALYWAAYLLLCLSSHGDEVLVDWLGTSLFGILSTFLQTSYSLFWLELMSLTKQHESAWRILQVLSSNSSPALRKFSGITADMRSFIEKVTPAISLSTPHLYLCLTWLEASSRLATPWKDFVTVYQILKEPLELGSGPILSIPCPKRVDTFAVSRDGSRIVSGSRDGFVRVHNLLDGSLVSKRHVVAEFSEQRGTHDCIHGHSESEDPLAPGSLYDVTPPVDALAFTQGGLILCVTGCIMQTLSTETLDPERTSRSLEGITKPIRSMAVSANPEFIAFGTDDGRLILTDESTLSIKWDIEAHENAVYALAFSSDSSQLASASCDGVRIWSAREGDFFRYFATHYTATTVSFSPDGRRVAYGELWGVVTARDIESGEWVGRWERNHWVLFLAFSPDGTRLFTSIANKIEGMHFKPGEAVEFPPPTKERCYIEIWPSGNRASKWPEQSTIHAWNIDVIFREKKATFGHVHSVTSVAFSPDGKRIVSGAREYAIRVWDAETGYPVQMAIMEHRSWIRFVVFSPDGKYIASGGDDRLIRIWDSQTGAVVHVLEGHTDRVQRGAYSPDGRRIVSGSYDRTLRLWDTSNGQQIRMLMEGHRNDINSVIYSADGLMIASNSREGIRIWDGLTGEAHGPHSFGRNICCIKFSPNSAYIAAGDSHGDVQLWDVKKRSPASEPQRGHTKWIEDILFSPDASYLVTGSNDKMIRCWDSSTGASIGEPLIGHTGGISSLAISPDGRQLASGSDDSCIRVWDSSVFHWKADHSLAICGLLGPEKIPASISDDGWIRSSDGGLLLFVPADYREAICEKSVLCIASKGGDRAIRIEWERLRYGEQWACIKL